ncbi:armadillo-type protein [Mycena latifolia]|nr:armadillo-type protein [Mycena latifolia]
MRLMYERDVVAFIKAQQGTELSKEAMEICGSYLACQYVAYSTKTTILMELHRRAASEYEACTVVDSLTLDLVEDLLGSPDAGVRASTCAIMTGLSRHKSSMTALLVVNPCPRLLSLLRDENLGVIGWAAEALYRIAESPGGAQAVLSAGVLEFAPTLLESPSPGVRRWGCAIFGVLARNQYTAMTILATQPCMKLVSLLRDTNDTVIEGAVYALCEIAGSAEGAQAVIHANVYNHLAKLVASPNLGVRKWTRTMSEKLVHQKTTTLPFARQLVALLRYGDSKGDSEIIKSATRALYWVTRSSPEAAQALVDANVLDCINDLLENESQKSRSWAPGWICEILREVGRHDITLAVNLYQCERLVSLVRDKNPGVIERATCALWCISRSPEGAQAIVNANFLACVDGLLESRDSEVLQWTCETLGCMARQRSTMTVVLAVKPCRKIVYLLNAIHLEVFQSAAKALCNIAQWADGAQASIEAKLLDCIPELLESPNPEVRMRGGKILESSLLDCHIS